jgi:hypothetical protein
VSGAKHTPGPWSVPHYASGHGVCTCGYVFAYDLTVAEVYRGGRTRDEPAPDEAKANAHMIAAAPDMLAALLKLAEAAEAYMKYHADKFYSECEAQPTGLWPFIRTARAAIAKAEGR